MAKGQQIKRRIRSVGSMLQVTKAMELISSIKMRKAQEAANRSKSYVFESWESIMRLASDKDIKESPYLNEPEEGKVLIMAIASDRGLAGSYNSNVLRKILEQVEKYGEKNIDFITVGAKVEKFVRKIGGNIVAHFDPGQQQIRFTMISPMALIAWEGFSEGKYKKFISIHTHFDSIIRMSATTLQILPIEPQQLAKLDKEGQDETVEYIFEPDKKLVLEKIIRQVVRALTYQAVLESEAAEHASRMVAMKNASDAADDLKEDFEFTYNQLRQQSITSELAEISAGANALNN
jgi:F-type H+-transporting ATPase subunit gamma